MSAAATKADVDEILDLLRGFIQQVDERFTGVENDIAELKSDVGELKSDMTHIKSDLAELKQSHMHLLYKFSVL